MKELTIGQKAKRYDEIIARAKGANISYYKEDIMSKVKEFVDYLLPELNESREDEMIRIIKEVILNSVPYKINILTKDTTITAEEAIAWLEKQGKSKFYSWKPSKEQFEALDYAYNSCSDTERGNYYEGVLETLIEDLHRLENQGEQKPAKNIVETWKDMRLEVYQQASGNRHEPNCSDDTTKMFSLNDIDEIVEKMSEQSPTDKAEQKFHKDDWIVHHGTENIYQVVAIIGNQYQLKYGDNYTVQSCADVDRCARLWDITKDAKDGDVLCTYECDEPKIVFILKGTPKKHYALSYHCYYNIMYPHFGSDSEKGCLAPNDEDVKPATKEQRDQLEKAMADAGYTFDFEKKELKEIEEEFNGEDYGIDSLWHAQNILERTLGCVEGYQSDDGILEHKCAITAVKKLYGQKSAWSEEDESHIRYLIECLEHCKKGVSLTMTTPTAQEYIDWLKSLRPQSHWKPSKEQMEVLAWCKPLFADPKSKGILESLINDLKKLMER